MVDLRPFCLLGERGSGVLFKISPPEESLATIRKGMGQTKGKPKHIGFFVDKSDQIAYQNRCRI